MERGADPMSFWRSPLAALAAVLVLAVLWRFPARDAEWSFVFCEGDSLLQLHRVKQCLADFPHVSSVDADSHYPDGYRVPWNPLHTVAYATFAKVTGAPPDLDGLARRLGWAPEMFKVGDRLKLVIAPSIHDPKKLTSLDDEPVV